MTLTSTIARILLGLLFLVFGLNGFLQFIKQPPPTGPALQFFMALLNSHEIAVVMLLQIVGGILLLANRFVPLALVVLGPVLVNIFLFHAFMAPAGLPMATIVGILWILVAWQFRPVFSVFFQSKVSGEVSKA